MGIGKRAGLSHSIGIETGPGRFSTLIKKGTPLPATVTEGFTWGDPNLTSFKIKPIHRGYPLNKSLGIYEVTEIPGPGTIRVTFSVDADGSLSITATDEITGQDLPVIQR